MDGKVGVEASFDWHLTWVKAERRDGNVIVLVSLKRYCWVVLARVSLMWPNQRRDMLIDGCGVGRWPGWVV
jgi:hypothetical protein